MARRLASLGGRAGYLFNTGIAGIEEADAILLIGTNPRLEAPVLNARIRKRLVRGGCPIGVIGERADLTYPYTYLGAGPDTLNQFLASDQPSVAQAHGDRGAGCARPCRWTAGSGRCLRRRRSTLGAIKDGWNGFNVLHTAAGRVGALDVCALPSVDGGMTTRQILDAAKSGELDILFLLGADEIDTTALGSTFVVYQGTHGDAGAHRADVILAGAAYTEKHVTYVNTEGRAQMTQRASFPPGEAREDWAIFRALSEAHRRHAAVEQHR